MKTKFGGLNTVSGELALPKDDSPSLLNVDFDIGGSVRKRNGTLTVYKDLVTPNPVSVHRFVTTAGYEFLISKYNSTLRVLDFTNDRAEILWQRSGVFKNVAAEVFSIPLDDNINLLLCEKQAPIQVRFDEVTATAVADDSIEIDVGEAWVNTYVDCVVYVNGVRVERVVDYVDGVLTIDSTDIVAGASVYVATFSWQWWAESLIWFGDNFYQRVSRFGVSDEDKHVQVPNSLVTDEIPDSSQYGVFAYINDAFGETYVYKSDNQPKISVEYSFSDGSNYTPSFEAFTSPSKFFVTFGDISSVNERTFTDKDIVGNEINILKHKLKTLDVVTLSNSDGELPVNTSESDSYFVKVNDDDKIELYNDAALTSVVTIGLRTSKNFTDLAVNYTDNVISITAHGFTIRQPIRFVSTNTLLIGLDENTVYYAKPIFSNTFEVYFDKNLRKKVIFVYRSELFFDSSSVASDILNIPQHRLFTGDAVRVKTTNGTLPPTLVATSVYYVLVLTANAIKLFSDSALTTVVPNYTGLAGDIFLYLDGGVHSVVVDGMTTTIKRVAYDSVSFVRLRQLRFNNKKGILNNNLDVYVGDDEVPRSLSLTVAGGLSYYTHESESLTPYVGSTTLQKFVSFTADTPIGVRKDQYVRLVNTERKWCGASALSTKYNFDNGSYVPAYGLGDYANYDEGVFPTFGALYQSRLCLAGVNSSILVSGVYDKIINGEAYRYFQVTDDLSNPVIDPFTIRVPFSQSDTVLAIKQWQQFLFVFTRTSTYKTTLDQNGQFNAATPTLSLTANVGCIGRDGVETTESTMFFLSENGVFDLGIVAQNEYRASEISVAIRDIIQEFGEDSKIVYDTFNNKLYVYNKRLMVYFTDQKVWSEYRAALPWDISSLLFWREFVFLCCKNLCDFQIIRTEYEKYIDFAQEFTEGLITVQPCAQTVPMYAGVNTYESPLITSPVYTQQDFALLINQEMSEFGVDWYKLNDREIFVVAPTDGVLTFLARVKDSYNGAVLFQDNEEVPLNSGSLGLVSTNNVCEYIPFDGQVDDDGFPIFYRPTVARLAVFATLSLNYADTTNYNITTGNYLTYADLVASGEIPEDVESRLFTDGFTTLEITNASTSSELKSGDFGVRLTVSKPYIGVASVNLEVWSTEEEIPLSTIFTFIGESVGGAYANTSNANRVEILSGNPKRNTTTGILQPNGLYKTILNGFIEIPLGTEPTYTKRTVSSPVDVPEVGEEDETIYIGGVIVDGIPFWSCSGGVCSPDPSGTYLSQAECEAALIPPAFSGGQCAASYTVTINYTTTILPAGTPVIPDTLVAPNVRGPISAVGASVISSFVGDSPPAFTNQYCVWIRAFSSSDFLPVYYRGFVIDPTLGRLDITSVSVTRNGGLPDDCGSLPFSCPI
jgi:hypothetical protein